MNMRAPDRQFQPGPEALNPVDVATLVNVLADTVINRPVGISGLRQAIVRPEFIRMDRAALFHVLSDNRLQGSSGYMSPIIEPTSRPAQMTSGEPQ